MQKSSSSATPHPPGHDLAWDDLRHFLAVARCGTVSAAARHLGVNATTVARRIRALEASLGRLLFEKSRHSGFVLTEDGQRLLPQADQLDSAVLAVQESLGGGHSQVSGLVRLACTEGLGTSFLAPELAQLQAQHPALQIDLMPLPHFVSLSKREADLLVTLERPERGAYVVAKLCDYDLAVYAHRDYLARHPPITTAEQLAEHPFVAYVDALAFSGELLYQEQAVPLAPVRFRSTSVVAQAAVVRQGLALGILPCFLAAQYPQLVPVLPQVVRVRRSFWLCCREDLRSLRRIRVVWDWLQQRAQAQTGLFQGASAAADSGL